MKNITLQLNAKLQPLHRGEMFEDLIEEILNKEDAGEITGGGTLQTQIGEVKYCDIELEIKDEKVDNIINILKDIKLIPKGSKILCEDKEIELGYVEGLAIYLNATELDEEVYQSNDVNELIACLNGAINGNGFMYSWWEGQATTALYYYGPSFQKMYEAIKNVVDTHPLCMKSEIIQIA